jgi:phosphatidylserine/phosphatidylglycerophosphate/cardiolipin synthase-like enzyme
MSKLICVPVHRVKCQVRIDKGRAWTPVEELILWAISRRPLSIAELVSDANLSHQIVVSAISRLMRFRFVKITAVDGVPKFAASAFGSKAVTSGEELPFYPQRSEMWISFAIERVTGRVFRARDVRRVRERDLEDLRRGPRARRTTVLAVTGEALDVSQDAMVARIAQLVTRDREEKLAEIVAGTATMSSEFIGVTVEDGMIRDLPERASRKLREAVLAAARKERSARFAVPYAGSVPSMTLPAAVSREFAPEDIVIGGSAQSALLKDLLTKAASRVVIHSTFVDYDDFEALLPEIQSACRRDVSIDVLWGAAHGEEAKTRYAATAVQIANLVRGDPVLHRRVRVGLQSTGSHAKLLLLDTHDGEWIGVVSSCNWLKSPFRSVELSTVLRHPRPVAHIASAIQKMAGARGLADELANEMGLLRRELMSQRGRAGTAMVEVITGASHDAMVRLASSEAQRRLIIGMHKLGATARPGALLPAEAASGSSKSVKVLYTMQTGPLKKRHARELEKEAAEHGVRLMRMIDIPLHGKFLLWDGDHVVISSLNWGSASNDPDFPLGDIGVHIHAPGIGESVYQRLVAIFPKLQDELPLGGVAA